MKTSKTFNRIITGILIFGFLFVGIRHVGAYIYNPTGTVITTPVTPANGGTGTSTVFTQGSVVFAGASGIYTQDNANFFFDDTNNRLGIGTSTPSTPLDVVNAGSGNIATFTRTAFVNGLSINASGSAYLVGLDTGTIDLAFKTNGTRRVSVMNSTGNLLVGGLTTDGTGVLQFPTATTSAGGISFGTDTFMYRAGAGDMRLTRSGTQVGWRFEDNSGGFAESVILSGSLILNSSSGSVVIKSNATTALTLDTSQNATFAHKVTLNSSGGTTSTDALTFGTDTLLYRIGAGQLKLDSTASDRNFSIVSSQTSAYLYFTEVSTDRGYLGYDGSNITLRASTSRGLIFQTSSTTALTLDTSQNATFSARILGKQSTVASANDMTLTAGNAFQITGTTTINTISATTWTAGSTIVLQFQGSLTVKNATAGTGAQFLLAGGADFSATANDTLTLFYNGTNWVETARTVI